MLLLVGLFGYIHVLSLLAALDAHWNATRALIGGILLAMMLLGNVLGKVPRNFYVGIRTPWTLADERVWQATHRLAARCVVAAGLIGLLAVVIAGWVAFSLVVLIVSFVIPVLYSLILYKRLTRGQEQ